jgi:hypothetical protein
MNDRHVKIVDHVKSVGLVKSVGHVTNGHRGKNVDRGKLLLEIDRIDQHAGQRRVIMTL